jgi:hypothetical protein
MLSWAFDDGPVSLWQPHLGEMPPELNAALHDPAVTKCAWNYSFERRILEFVLGIKTEQSEWLDPSVLCGYMSLPMGLGKAASALNISEQKQKTNGIKMFSEPSKATKKMLANGASELYFKNWDSHPAEWKQFCEYCIQDTITERQVYHAAVALNSPMTEEECLAWRLDQRMNETGVYIDQVFVANAKKLAEEESDKLLAQMKEITGLENPNSTQQLGGWLRERKYPYDSLDEEHVEEALKKTLPPEVVQVLKLKQDLGGSAYKKLQSIQDRIGPDGRLRDQFVYHGAHTGRWCLAEGSLIRVKTLSGAVIEKPIETVLLEDMVWDGSDWVRHGGVVFSGDREVIIHDGVRATPEHEVWITSDSKVSLSTALERGLPIWAGLSMPYQSACNPFCESCCPKGGSMKTYDILNAGPRNRFMCNGRIVSNSGRGVQLQNLFKPDKEAGKRTDEFVQAIRNGTFTPDTIPTMTVVASVIRAAFVASPGKKLVVGDLAQIESRVLAAMAGCQIMIDLYAGGHDLYKEFMSWLLEKPVDQIDSDERARGKIVILGCGYAMGWKKFIDYAATFGVILDEKQAKEAVYGFRKKYAEIPVFWEELNNAAKIAVKLRKSVYVKGVVFDGHDRRVLKLKLPSGRYIHYHNPRIVQEENWRGQMEDQVNYDHFDAKGTQVKRLYGGLLAENIVQAVSRDLLLAGMFEAEKAGFTILLTIHDEIVTEVPPDSSLGLDELLKCMTKIPEWGEEMGFVLAAEGWTGPYYRK